MIEEKNERWRLSVLLFNVYAFYTRERGWLNGSRRIRDREVSGSIPGRSIEIMFFSMVSFRCWRLFRYPFHPRVTAVARERSRSFCQKWRLQVTAKHTCILRIWLRMKWHCKLVHGVHRTYAETAAVWHSEYSSRDAEKSHSYTLYRSTIYTHWHAHIHTYGFWWPWSLFKFTAASESLMYFF